MNEYKKQSQHHHIILCPLTHTHTYSSTPENYTPIPRSTKTANSTQNGHKDDSYLPRGNPHNLPRAKHSLVLQAARKCLHQSHWRGVPTKFCQPKPSASRHRHLWHLYLGVAGCLWRRAEAICIFPVGGFGG